MIKVYLPKNNDNIDSYLNTRLAIQDKHKLNYQELEKIINLSLGYIEPNYKIIWQNRSQGQYIIIETTTEKKWISLSADYTTNTKNKGSTNAYFVQFIPMAIVDFFFDKTKKLKSLELYLKGTNHMRATTKAQQIYYRLAKTAKIKILNEYEFPMKIRKNINIPFKDINEWKLARIKMSKANRSNKSSYVIENDNSYTFYGKTFGANGRESIFILYVLAKLANSENKKIYLYEINDNGSFAFETSTNIENQKFKKMLKKLNIVYYADSIEYVENENHKELDTNKKDARYQAEFMRNLLIKYNSVKDQLGNIKYDTHHKPIIKDDIKRCYLCNCDIQKLIIASHIHRVTDINKSNLPFVEKRKQAVDGDNGLWLCANHDKLFEYGLIYFENDKLVISDNLSKEQQKYVNLLTYDIKKKVETINEDGIFDSQNIFNTNEKNIFTIKSYDYNEKMHNYLEIHKKRTQNIPTKNKISRINA